ncbi:MAG: hypothetical protein WCJ84_02495 [Candidatus Peregrinibacteria bacterium]
MLEYAQKYNWWTPDKSQLSEEALIGYVLEYGTLVELKKTIAQMGKTTVKKVWESSGNGKEKRKALITFLLEE